MEQDQKLVDIDNKAIENIFRLDYKGQKINNNLNFIKFKEEMLRKNNYKGRIFFAKTKIYIFIIMIRNTHIIMVFALPAKSLFVIFV